MKNIILVISVLFTFLSGSAQSRDSSKSNSGIAGGDDKDFEVFLVKFKSLLEKNDSLRIAGLIFYPLHAAYGNRSGSVTISNKKEFLKLYGVLFDKRMKRFLLSQTKDSAFSNYQGIAFGHGKLWIDQRLESSGKLVTKIMTINNSDKMWVTRSKK